MKYPGRTAAIYAAALMTASLAFSFSPTVASDSHQACTTSKKYIDFLQRRDFDGVGKLFAANAVFYTPVGTILRGSEAIGSYYKTAVASANLVLRGQNYVGTKNECFFEIWHRSKLNADGKYVAASDGDFARGAADHFTTDDQGLIVELVAFPAPTALPLGGAGR